MQHKSKCLIWLLKMNLILFCGQRQYLDFFLLIIHWTFYKEVNILLFLVINKILDDVESATSWTGMHRVENCLPTWHSNANCLTNCHLKFCRRKKFLYKIFKFFVFFKLTPGLTSQKARNLFENPIRFKFWTRIDSLLIPFWESVFFEAANVHFCDWRRRRKTWAKNGILPLGSIMYRQCKIIIFYDLRSTVIYIRHT